MARGSDVAQTGAKTGLGLSNQLEGNASSAYGTLMPELQAESANPQGFGPTDLAKMNTAAKQTAGGTQAGAVGQGALLAARTKNPGAASAAISESSRTAGEHQSQENLATEMANAKLKEAQRQSGLSGQEELTSLETNAGIGALGQVAPNVNANTNAANESWDWARTILDPALTGAGAGAGEYFRH